MTDRKNFIAIYTFITIFFILFLSSFYFLINTFSNQVISLRIFFLFLMFTLFLSALIIFLVDLLSKEFIHSFSHFKLTKKLLLRFFIISFVPIFIVGALFVINISIFSNNISEDVESQVTLLTQDYLSKEVSLIVRNIDSKMDLFSSSFELTNSLFDFSKLINQVENTGEIHYSHYYPDPITQEWSEIQNNFKTIHSSNPEEIYMLSLFHTNGYLINGIKLGNEDFSNYAGDKTWFKEVMETAVGEDKTYISSINTGEDSESFTINFISPVDINNERKGLFKMSFKSKDIFDELSEFLISTTTEVKIVDFSYINSEGNLLPWPVVISDTSTNSSFIINELEDENLYFDEEQLSNKGLFISYDDNNNKIINIYEKILFEEKSWYVFVSISEEEAYSSLNMIKNNSDDLFFKSIVILFIIFFLTLFFVFIIGFNTAQKITKPIKELFISTEKLTKKDFSVRTNIRSGDEIEDLGNNFNLMAEALEAVHSERQELDKTKTRFLSITSHELRSPMTPMKGQLQLLLAGALGKLSSEQKDSASIVLKNINRLDNIIVDFLEISRIEAARLKFFFIKSDLEKPIKSLIKEMNKFIPEKKITLKLEMDKLPIFEVDPNRIMQVLRNLINNAIKFSPNNSTIIVLVKKNKSSVEISVKDEGIGISELDQKRIFEPFFQAEQSMYRKYGGTGLGLAICSGIIKSQKGNFWIKSSPGKGSTFFFTIPFIPVKEIKPIKILFSSQEEIERKLRVVFNDILGPIGESEFETLKEDNQILEENLFKYVLSLYDKKIISRSVMNEFKSDISKTFSHKKRGGL